MLFVQKYQHNDGIYNFDYGHFGDIWAYTNLLLRISEGNGRPIRITYVNNYMKNLILKIKSFLNSKGRIIFTNKPKTRFLNFGDAFSIKFIPTLRTWNRKRALKSKIVAYQFDGRHLAEEKNLPPMEFRKLLNGLRKMGYIPVNVGGNKKLNFIINVMSNCKFFVGCPSGLSVVARSVKCPIFLITWKLSKGMIGVLKTLQCPTAKFFRTTNEFLNFTRINQSKLINLL